MNKVKNLILIFTFFLVSAITVVAKQNPLEVKLIVNSGQDVSATNNADTGYFDFYWPISSLPFLSSGQQTNVMVVLENTVNHTVYYDIIIEEIYPQPGWLGVSDFEYSVEHGLNNKDTGYINLNVGGALVGCEQVAYVAARLILVVEQYAFADTLLYSYIAECASNYQWDTVSTGVISLAVSNRGQFGGGATITMNGGARMDFFNNPAECDTVDSIPGETEAYIYDGGIFVGGIVGNDTIFACEIYSQCNNCEWAIHPLELPDGPTIDGILQTWNSGTMVNHDTSIAMEVTYYAPQQTGSWGVGLGWPADQQFITRELKVWSYDGQIQENVIVGEAIDWDIPSDSGSDNSGESDDYRKLVYCIGGEYDQDDSLECQDNNERYGGTSYSYTKKYNAATSSWELIVDFDYGGYIEANARYVYQGWNASELYTNIDALHHDYVAWVGPTPDSQQVDLHTVMAYIFEYDLQPEDTLVFYSVLATVRNASEESTGGSARIEELVDKGKMFTQYFGCCHGLKGDMNSDGVEGNLLDLNYMVNRIFRGGPKTLCDGEGDTNNDGVSSNLLDLSFLVNRVFRGGPAPVSCGTPPAP